MKKVLLGCLVGAFCAGPVFSQVNLCGKVLDDKGKPLTNTIVRLGQTTYDNGFGQNAYITKTDSTGYYHLGTGICATPVFKSNNPARPNAFSKPGYVGGQVLFTLSADNLPVVMKLYDLTGRFVKEIMNKRMSRGNYGIRVDAGALSSQNYLLRISINGSASVLKLQPFSRTQGVGIQTVSEFQTKLEKFSAIVDTLHATEPGYTIGVKTVEALTGSYNFVLTKNNTYAGDTAAFWGNMSSYPTNGSYVILNRTNGAFPDSKIFWSIQQNGAKTALSTSNTVKIPGGGGRFYIWIAPNDSNNRYFDFVEVNYGGSWLGNTTQVDGYRLPITFKIHSPTGPECTLGSSYHMFYQTHQSKWDEFINEVPKEFTKLATQNNANIYAMHTPPVNLFNTGGPYVDYYSKYEDSVLAHNPGQAKKNAWEISACTGGGMGGDPGYCSAVNRHCGHLAKTEWRNPKNFYLAPPCNYFSNWVHRRSLGSKAYGFPYDDYAEQAAFCGQANVQWLAIAIGW
jgi:hypothetical protein